MTARRPVDAPPPVHSDAAHAAIAAELVRCTLTGDHRPELVPLDLPAVLRTIGERLVAAFEPIRLALAGVRFEVVDDHERRRRREP